MAGVENQKALVVATVDGEEKDYLPDRLGCLYSVIKVYSSIAINSFFGEIDVVGLEHIPNTGPVILVGNHKNQFVDAMMVTSIVRRKVSFLAAEKSMHRRFIGDAARAMDAIPVIRPQDRARASPGTITGFDEASLQLLGSSECAFMTNVKKGEMVLLSGVKGIAPLVIQEVVSDTCLVIKKPVKGDDEPDAGEPATLSLPTTSPQGVTFKVIPKIDQSEVFKKVHDALCDGRCIGIFPEGGSSDRTDLLPLKIGVAIMALGAVARGAPVKIVPFGINYNEGHRWRSKVLVDIGKPITVPDSILEQYKAGATREAHAELLKQIESALRAVTFNAPDKHTLNILRTMRRLYQGEVKLPVKRFMELNRRFALAFGKFREDERFLDLVARVHDYMSKVQALGLVDRQVAALPPLGTVSSAFRSIAVLLVDIFIILFVFVTSIPGWIVFTPALLRINYVATHEVKRALASSRVKVKGVDVAASQKIISAMIWFTVTHLVYTGVAIGLSVGLWPRTSPYTAGTAEDWFFVNAVWLIPLGVALIVPFLAVYNVLAVDYALRRYKWMPYRLLILSSVCRSTSAVHRIRDRRKELSLRVQEFFDKIISPAFPEWKNDIIITRETLVAKRRKSDHIRAVQVAEEIDEIAKTTPMPDSPSLPASRKTIAELKLSMKRMEDSVTRFQGTNEGPKLIRQQTSGIGELMEGSEPEERV